MVRLPNLPLSRTASPNLISGPSMWGLLLFVLHRGPVWASMCTGAGGVDGMATCTCNNATEAVARLANSRNGRTPHPTRTLGVGRGIPPVTTGDQQPYRPAPSAILALGPVRPGSATRVSPGRGGAVPGGRR
ncbi:hypothetical protein FRIGORI9N_350061 [Frigoribacterium sp. 9N]|nr:hypothetical protein FRIGORI9N_350061 [Frigoribacterium sp. 9N]